MSLRYVDGTAVQDAQILAAGLATTLLPAGQKFFALSADDPKYAERDDVKRYFAMVEEVAHQKMFSSNFTLNINETIYVLSCLGTGCLYADWDQKTGGLTYKDYDISLYQIKENSEGFVDTIILSYELTARQAVQEYGLENCSEEIQKAAEDLANESNRFPFIHCVRPRETNPLAKKVKDSFRWESLHVDEKAKAIVKESGYETFPFAVARWRKSWGEKYGIGQGLVALADIRMLQRMRQSFQKLANRLAEPPMEAVIDDLEGTPNLNPNAVNWVRSAGSFKGVDQGAIGNFPVTVEAVEKQQQIIHDFFFRKAFLQFSDLTKRMTTVEIRARQLESLKLLAQPVARVQEELLTPTITRTIELLMKWGVIPRPPEWLKGYKIEYLGQLALALRDQQATAAVQFTQLVVGMAEVAPEAVDVIDFDKMLPDVARTYGMKVEHIATPEAIAAKREARAEQMAVQQALEAAEVAGKVYGKTKDAPATGSPAEEMVGAGRE
ncbi:hypothetical protein ES708_25492 [subsurface metagenome]